MLTAVVVGPVRGAKFFGWSDVLLFVVIFVMSLPFFVSLAASCGSVLGGFAAGGAGAALFIVSTLWDVFVRL